MLLNHVEYGEHASKDVLVLLHGMLGSHCYWRGLVPYLPGKRIIAFDLLGFGSSPKPKSITYDYDTHLRSITETLDHLELARPFTLVGHSMGALLSLRLAAVEPARVDRLVLISMPVYRDAASARREITGSRRLKEMLLYGRFSRTFCLVWCSGLRPLSSRIAPFYLRRLPRDVPRATVRHSWKSYSESLANVIEQQQVAADLARLECRTTLIYGTQDPPAELRSVLEGGAEEAPEVLSVPGGHQLPLEQPREVAALIDSPVRDEDRRRAVLTS